MGLAGAPVRRMPVLGAASPPDALENREPRLNRGPHQCHSAAETAVLRGSIEKLQVHGDGCEKTSQLVFKPTNDAHVRMTCLQNASYQSVQALVVVLYRIV